MLSTAKTLLMVGLASGAVTVNVSDVATLLVLLGALLLVVNAPTPMVLM